METELPPAAPTLPRRQLLGSALRTGLGLAALPAALQALGWLSPEAALALEEETGLAARQPVAHSRSLPGRRIQCSVCPLDCVLEDGQTCFCRTRTNLGGTLYTRAWSNPCIIRPDDPIEKLPLHHWLPGARTLSLATGGCNLRCLYCQNWQQSQELPDRLRTYDLPPSRALDAARRREHQVIAWAYTEPVTMLEYLLATARVTGPAGIRHVAATAACIKRQPLLELCEHVDALVMALKAFDQETHLKLTGQDLAPILEALVTARGTDVHLEVVTLLVPGWNDSPQEVRELVRWVRRNLGQDTPLHLARFLPEHKLRDLPSTPLETLTRARQQALDAGLRYVYCANVAPHPGNHTYCGYCGAELITRRGFDIIRRQLDASGTCPSCQGTLPGVWNL